jgi:hypothetical protein
VRNLGLQKKRSRRKKRRKVMEDEITGKEYTTSKYLIKKLNSCKITNN